MSNSKNSQLLLKAADVVRARGLAKGKYEDTLGRVCTVGAINTVLLGKPYAFCQDRKTLETKRVLLRAVKDVINFESTRISLSIVTEFNDAEGHIVEDVILVLEQAAANLKEDNELA